MSIDQSADSRIAMYLILCASLSEYIVPLLPLHTLHISYEMQAHIVDSYVHSGSVMSGLWKECSQFQQKPTYQLEWGL